MIDQYDVVVIGGGPAGYIAALKAARLGGKTALVERDTVGGTCLNRGCIPTKTFLKTAEMIDAVRALKARGVLVKDDTYSVDINVAVAEKNKVVKKLTGGVAALLKSSGVTVYSGEAVVENDRTVVINGATLNGAMRIAAKSVIVAGGSKANRIRLPGMDSPRVLTSDEILDLKEMPKSLLVIGGGVIGVEMATIFSRFQSRVSIVELEDRILPQLDADVSNALRKALTAQGIRIVTSAKLLGIEETETGIRALIEGQEPIEAERALLSIGRVPDVSALQNVNVEMVRGRPAVNEYMQTSVDWIYAPGDVNGKLMLAHAALRMGEIAALNALGHRESVDLNAIPSCVYTTPEIGCVGLTEEQARKDHDVSIGRFPFSANGRALASGEGEGFVKVIADQKYGELLGVHIVGPSAAELVNEAAALMRMEITAEEIASIVHAHPTYSEAFMEASADSIGECLHLPFQPKTK